MKRSSTADSLQESRMKVFLSADNEILVVVQDQETLSLVSGEEEERSISDSPDKTRLTHSLSSNRLP